MRVGSLFSGIGGLDFGLERAGMEIVWQVEVDEWCRRVLERHWPHVARFRDVRDCHGAYAPQFTGAMANGHANERTPQDTLQTGRETIGDGCLPSVDLICGGFPCQPVSHAGRRMGESDSRWLWPEFYRIICEVRPRWVLAENVPGLLSVDSGRLFGGILRDLAEAGYDAVWFVLSAADVGAPHLRERVFIVAHADSDRARQRCDSHAFSSQPRTLPARGNSPYPQDAGTDTDDSDKVAYTSSAGLAVGQQPENGRGDIRGEGSPTTESSWWAIEPNMGRVAHGVPARVDRLRGLGNAVVPQVAEWIGRWILMVPPP